MRWHGMGTATSRLVKIEQIHLRTNFRLQTDVATEVWKRWNRSFIRQKWEIDTVTDENTIQYEDVKSETRERELIIMHRLMATMYSISPQLCIITSCIVISSVFLAIFLYFTRWNRLNANEHFKCVSWEHRQLSICGVICIALCSVWYVIM